ncbi:MAG: N-acetyltransferase family protein [Mongoliitalea sp.]
MIEIKSATVTDISIIQSIAEETWPITFGEILSSEQIRYMLDWMYSTEMLQRQLEQEGHVFLLAWDSELGEALGFAGVQHGLKNQLTKIHKLYIRPSQQGRGIGKKLIQSIQKMACMACDRSLVLNVNKYNLQAIKFYEYIGFKEIDQEVINIGNGYVMDDFVLELPLVC